MVWAVTPEGIPSENPSEEFSSIGIRNVKWEKFNLLSSIAKIGKKNIEMPQPYYHFLSLWPGDWKKQLA